MNFPFRNGNLKNSKGGKSDGKVSRRKGIWQLDGKGTSRAFGKVYRIEREDFGTLYQAAMKKIVIPQSEKEIQEALGEGMDMQSVTGYFRSFVEEIVNEFRLMARMKGHTNIVSYEDHLAMTGSVGIF